jgi:hypothetical protein
MTPQSIQNNLLIMLAESRSLRRKLVRHPVDAGFACCRNCELESTWFARSAVSDLVAPMHTSRLDRRDEGLHAEDVHDPREICFLFEYYTTPIPHLPVSVGTPFPIIHTLGGCRLPSYSSLALASQSTTFVGSNGSMNAGIRPDLPEAGST